METIGTHATTYEYRTVEVASNLEPLARDTYTNLGWAVEPTTKGSGRLGHRTLTMKRDRRIGTKPPMHDLQDSCDQALAAIDRLEGTKTGPAKAAAWTVGLVGCAFLALSVFSYLAGNMALMVACAVPGFLCWIVPHFLFKTVARHTAAKRAPQISTQYERIYSASERAAAIMAEGAA